MSNQYAPQTPANHRAPKKNRTKWYIGGAVLAALAVIGVSTGTSGDKTPEGTGTTAEPQTAATQPLDAETSTPQADGHTLTFTGSTSDGGTASVTYLGKGGQITQAQDAPMPWSVDIDGLGNKWDVLGANISLQRDGGAGEVTCRVLWDGEEVASNTSSGPYSIASCSLPTDL